ncbi:MAG: hypothetical protein ACXWLH_01935 [Candidatus Saccharimonadales bacterium]
MEPIGGEPEGKNVLSMRQFDESDIQLYIDEAYAAEAILANKESPGINLLPYKELKAVMRQPSTRTAGTITRAMAKLGGEKELISGMAGSSEAKGETLEDSWVAFATQAEVIGTRTAEEYGPLLAATAIEQAVVDENIEDRVPVINLGDGQNEHPTQTLGDLFTVHKVFHRLEGLKLAVVGDQERYRAFHSLMLGALTVGMEVTAVQTEVAPVPDYLIEIGGDKLIICDDLDTAMHQADVLYIGRRPDEYEQKVEKVDEFEARRSLLLERAYDEWIVNRQRLQIMPKNSIVLHPRPRRGELHRDADADPRTKDIQQMVNMIPIRMAILAGVFGKSIRQARHAVK